MKLSSGNTYNSHARQQIPALEEDTTVETELYASEKTDKTIARYSPDMIDENIKTNVEPLNAQISALTEMMDRLFQGNSAREFTTPTTRELRLQSQSPLVDSRLPSCITADKRGILARQSRILSFTFHMSRNALNAF